MVPKSCLPSGRNFFSLFSECVTTVREWQWVQASCCLASVRKSVENFEKLKNRKYWKMKKVSEVNVRIKKKIGCFQHLGQNNWRFWVASFSYVNYSINYKLQFFNSRSCW
jgi:hypothetical protein